MDYNFTPVKRFSVYIGGEINASLINGDARVWFERRGNPLGDSLESYIFSSSFRIGYGINAGTEYLVNSGFGLNLGFKFSNLNAFTKKADGSNGESEFELRDDYKQGLIFSGNKNFSFFSIFGGVNIYFGVKELKQNL
jgi:opacity protein-like surface antigen